MAWNRSNRELVITRFFAKVIKRLTRDGVDVVFECMVLMVRTSPRTHQTSSATCLANRNPEIFSCERNVLRVRPALVLQES